MQPIQLPFENEDERFETVRQKVALYLEPAGFELVPADEFMKVYETVGEEWGAVLDPYTGRTIPEKLDRYLNELSSALTQELGCDARLQVSLSIVRARFVTPMASWDGTQRQVVSASRTALSILGGDLESGWVSATSIWIELMDLKGAPIAFRSAGVETLAELSLGRDADKLPIDRWLRNEEHLNKALQSALGTRAEHLREKGTSEGPIDRALFEWPHP